MASADVYEWNADQPRKRKSRWDPSGTKTFIPGVPSFMPVFLSQPANECFMLRVRIDEITHKLTSAQLDIPPEHERSPSPPPVYDSHGKRLNTREMRVKEKLMRERQKYIERAQDLNPMFKAPADYRPLATKKYRKLYIPLKKHPEYNFIGLIIGPRGITQKTMEKETGAKIAIRGKGSVKDGKKADKMNFGDDDELHVLVQADTDEALEAASALVAKLLVPVEEGKNEHKRQQLRKLAEYNGTLRDQSFQRDQAAGKAYTGIDVVCGICGEPSHPTADCPLKGQPGVKSKLDREYENFLSEIGEAPKTEVAHAPASAAAAAADRSYEEFMASLGEAPSGGGGGGGANPPAPQAGGAPAPPPWASAPVCPTMLSLTHLISLTLTM